MLDNKDQITSSLHPKRHSTESLADNQTVYTSEKEEEFKRYSLYDKWTRQDTKKDIEFGEIDYEKTDSKQQVIEKEQKSFSASSLNVNQNIEQKIKEESGGQKEVQLKHDTAKHFEGKP